MAGIYIHIPFCKQACFYCDFHFSTSLKKKDELIFCLAKELEIRKNEFKSEAIETIYFGGGTPSLLTKRDLDFLFKVIYQNYSVIKNPEITLEANPDDLSEEKIIELSNTPINRLSIGIQSFFENDLQSMNRSHNQQEAKECLTIATQYFQNISIDLIYGIPKMSNEKWQKNLQIAFDFGVQHISSYALTVEPKTALENFIKQGEYPKINENTAKEHFDILVEETSKNGFTHYEISNFGQKEYFSKHNTSYWQGKKYLGIGPSAHSFNQPYRSWNIANNSIYISKINSGILPKTTEKLSKRDQFNESLMTSLRTIWGVSLNDLDADLKANLLKSAQKFIDLELLIIEEKFLKTTQKGKFLADGLASDLFII